MFGIWFKKLLHTSWTWSIIISNFKLLKYFKMAQDSCFDFIINILSLAYYKYISRLQVEETCDHFFSHSLLTPQIIVSFVKVVDT